MSILKKSHCRWKFNWRRHDQKWGLAFKIKIKSWMRSLLNIKIKIKSWVVTFEHQNQNQKLDFHFWTSKSKSIVGWSLLKIKIKSNSWMGHFWTSKPISKSKLLKKIKLWATRECFKVECTIFFNQRMYFFREKIIHFELDYTGIIVIVSILS